MVLVVANDAPKLTDWITAIAAIIGVPLSAVAFFRLVRRDKDRQNQINKLTNIAGALENQTEVMVKQNELIAQQVDIFRNTNILKGQDAEALLRLQSIEDQKLRLSIKPRLSLTFDSYLLTGNEWRMILINRGELAHIIEFKVVSGALQLVNTSATWDMEKGDKRYITGYITGLRMVVDAEYEIEIRYSNTLGHPYRALFHGKSSSIETVKDEPLV